MYIDFPLCILHAQWKHFSALKFKVPFYTFSCLKDFSVNSKGRLLSAIYLHCYLVNEQVLQAKTSPLIDTLCHEAASVLPRDQTQFYTIYTRGMEKLYRECLYGCWKSMKTFEFLCGVFLGFRSVWFFNQVLKTARTCNCVTFIINSFVSAQPGQVGRQVYSQTDASFLNMKYLLYRSYLYTLTLYIWFDVMKLNITLSVYMYVIYPNWKMLEKAPRKCLKCAGFWIRGHKTYAWLRARFTVVIDLKYNLTFGFFCFVFFLFFVCVFVIIKPTL